MASAKIVELDETNTCKICDNALAKYSCPRCNILYCSLVCYQHQNHLECSEDFYKESVLDSLNLEKDNPESKAKMMEILQRVHEENKINVEVPEDDDLDDEGWEDLDSDDNEDVDDMIKRFEGVDLDNADKVWEVLTEDERKDFVAFLKSNDVTKFVTPWEPWWSYSNKNKVLEVDDQEFEAHKLNCPQIKDIKDFSTITRKTPADCVRFNLYNILAAYCFTVRYFNGEHHDFAQDAVTYWAAFSLCIKSKENFSDYETAVKSVEHEIINSNWVQTDKENINAMREDLAKILEGPNSSQPKFYILCALSDICGLLEKALTPSEKTNFQKIFPDYQLPEVKLETQEDVEGYTKKIDYFLSYVKDLY